MKLLLIVMALTTASYAAKLDRTYLPPSGALNSGGSPGSLQAPVMTGRSNGPTSSESSHDQYRGPTSLAGAGLSNFDSINSASFSPANTYSSMTLRGFNSISSSPVYDARSNEPTQTNRVFTNSQVTTERPQSAQDRSSDIIHQHSDISADGYSYGFETANGISAEESGVATNGVQAKGGFSYMGDDGNKYSITYTADENGYRPQGEHLPTPPPIPDVILRSLETIARAKALGISYEDGNDGIKYNNGQESNGLVEQYNAPSKKYDFHSNNAPDQQNNIPVQQSSLPVERFNAVAQKYGQLAQPNNFNDYNTPSNMYRVSAEQNNQGQINSGLARRTDSLAYQFQQQHFDSPPTQSEIINNLQIAPSSQQYSGPYNYNSPSQQYNAAVPSEGKAPSNNGFQSQRVNVPEQKYGTATQSYNGPARGDNQGVRPVSTPNESNRALSQTNGPVQSYNRPSEQKIVPVYEAQHSNSPNPQYTSQGQGIKGHVNHPTKVQQLSNRGSHQANAPAHINAPTQKYNTQTRSDNMPAQQYNNKVPTPTQHSIDNQYDAHSQSNNRGTPQYNYRSHHTEAPILTTPSQDGRYSAPSQQSVAYAPFENRPGQQEARGGTRNQFSANRAPATFSPETGYKY